METAPDDVKDNLRTELFMLLQDLKRLEYVGVDDVAEFMSTTRAHPADSCRSPDSKTMESYCSHAASESEFYARIDSGSFRWMPCFKYNEAN